MSRLASKPVVCGAGVAVTVVGTLVKIKGPKGELAVTIPNGIEVKVEGSDVHVSRRDDSCKPLQGLVWSLVRNAVIGVSTGYSRKIEIVGKGWRSTVKGNVINLQVGHSHPVDFKLPDGVSATQENPGSFTLFSHDKQLLGQTCADIQGIRPVEPYKLKGIRLQGQVLRQKARKAAGV
ncbi:MAG: 50S ribosomal protein L6 [Chrysiogenales bacterium]|jgi:large subunit ribosomal protein L6|nr:50S ribosomal protein L6 [Candidatus Aminicenantes bacterium]TFG80386.1 MAG: 50S ribosomal protein L6 [Chrysiogenales bacterium]